MNRMYNPLHSKNHHLPFNESNWSHILLENKFPSSFSPQIFRDLFLFDLTYERSIRQKHFESCSSVIANQGRAKHSLQNVKHGALLHRAYNNPPISKRRCSILFLTEFSRMWKQIFIKEHRNKGKYILARNFFFKSNSTHFQMCGH